MVFLADAIGMASFRPRNILTEKRSQRRFPFVGLTKRNPYIFDETVVKTAVKTLKGTKFLLSNFYIVLVQIRHSFYSDANLFYSSRADVSNIEELRLACILKAHSHSHLSSTLMRCTQVRLKCECEWSMSLSVHSVRVHSFVKKSGEFVCKEVTQVSLTGVRYGE